jgi:5'-nucleotidase
MPRILLTNDDGYLAEGLGALADELGRWAEVVVVAPDRERSGSGRSITLHHPLRLTELKPAPRAGSWHLVNGTPTDCVNLAVHFVLADRPPDLVVSGINHGLNLGDDVFYSGTVNAACEARQFELPAVALSQEPGERDMTDSARVASLLLRRLVAEGPRPELLLNVNFPAAEIRGVQVTRLGRRVYRDVVVAKTDPRGQAYYWLAGKPQWDDAAGNDQEAILRGFASVTPLRMSGFTDDVAMEQLAKELQGLELDAVPGG